AKLAISGPIDSGTDSAAITEAAFPRWNPAWSNESAPSDTTSKRYGAGLASKCGTVAKPRFAKPSPISFEKIGTPANPNPDAAPYATPDRHRSVSAAHTAATMTMRNCTL